MHIWEFIKTYWLDILIVLLTVSVIVLAWVKGKKREILALARSAVLLAEEHLGSKTGQAKKAEAIAWIYQRLPVILKLIFTEKAIDNLIEKAVEWLHKQLDNCDELGDRLQGAVLAECVYSLNEVKEE